MGNCYSENTKIIQDKTEKKVRTDKFNNPPKRNTKTKSFLNDIKISVIGGKNVGKSKIYGQISGTKLQKGTQYCTGSDARSFQVTEELQVLAIFWHTSGQETLYSHTGEVIKSSNIVFVVYSIDDYKSFEDVETTYANIIDKYCKEGVSVVLVGNKQDLRPLHPDSEEMTFYVSHKEGKSLAEKHNWKFIEISVEQDNDLQEIFKNILSGFCTEMNKTQELQTINCHKW